jgi:excisionase family DNA binding protein
MTTTAPRRQWVSIAYVEEFTGLARPTIYRMAREGRIPAFKVGRSTRFDAAELDRWQDKLPRASA